MPEKPHLCAAGSMPPSRVSWCFHVFVLVQTKAHWIYSLIWNFPVFHVLSNPMCFPALPAEPRSDPSVLRQSLELVEEDGWVINHISSINLLSSAQYSTSYQLKKLILTLNFTKLSYDLEYCYDRFIFVFLIFGALDFIIKKKRIINIIRKNGDWFYSLEWIIPVIECFFI